MEPLHVAVGVILNTEGQVLIVRRAADSHQGGLWEFPGGKVEVTESVEEALYRELREELGIEIEPASPLLEIHHDYGDKAVLLDVWLIRQFAGTPRGCEGQPLEWVALGQLDNYNFPAANAPILAAVEKLL